MFLLFLSKNNKNYQIMNKKRLLNCIAIVAIAISAALNTSINTGENGLSDISLDNVEALAQESNNINCMATKGFCVKNGMKDNYVSFD